MEEVIINKYKVCVYAICKNEKKFIDICEFNLGNKEEALKYVKEALKFNLNDDRIKNNLKIIENME